MGRNRFAARTSPGAGSLPGELTVAAPRAVQRRQGMGANNVSVAEGLLDVAAGRTPLGTPRLGNGRVSRWRKDRLGLRRDRTHDQQNCGRASARVHMKALQTRWGGVCGCRDVDAPASDLRLAIWIESAVRSCRVTRGSWIMDGFRTERF
jgi:hypothetical protein